MSRRLRAGAAGLAVASLVLTGCTGGDDAVERGQNFEFVAPGGQTDIDYPVADRQELPNVSGEDLMNDGQQLSLDRFRGKVIVLNLWGQWCPPCRAEASELQKIQVDNAAKGVQVVGLDVRDSSKDAPRDFVKDRGLTYPSIYDEPGRSLLPLTGYPRNAVPSTIVIDKQHRVAAVFLRQLLASDLQPVVDRLVAE